MWYKHMRLKLPPNLNVDDFRSQHVFPSVARKSFHIGWAKKNSFVVSRAGAIIGHDVESTDINLPSDPTLIG